MKTCFYILTNPIPRTLTSLFEVCQSFNNFFFAFLRFGYFWGVVVTKVRALGAAPAQTILRMFP